MAKATLEPLFTGLSGTLGDAVLVSGMNGQYIRARPTYRRPTSAG